MHRLDRLRSNIRRCFFGHDRAIEQVVICLLARGHMLIEDVPGVGKTMLATSLAKSLDCSLARIQLTPDMLPADVLGVSVWDQHKGEFVFKPGPIFSNILLADEINRTTPRTQSAMLEAMNEAQVSVDGHTRKLLEPFIVIATQNPFEFEGTYFLPESQLDRFLVRVNLGYPSAEDEARILTTDPARTELADLKPVMTADDLVELQHQTEAVTIDKTLVDYVVRLADATRKSEELQVGVSPRGSLALVRAAKGSAMLAGRDYVVPEDVVDQAVSVFAHRVVPKTYMHDAEGVAAPRIIRQILETQPSPV